VALTFAAMWWVPEGATLGGRFAPDTVRLMYILLLLLLFYTACTVFEIPHGALGMEMSKDTHERTRLFSGKSFLGNLFAMGTPWLFFLANLEIFRGVGGNEADGMRWVSMLIAALLIPAAFWWFKACREPPASGGGQRVRFLDNLKSTFRNRLFLLLVAVFFILAMGFNFVALLNYYIVIFYLYGGDKVAAGALLGINGTVWAVTGLLAVFPLNWLDRRLGKRSTLVCAILLMCGAQLSKIVCYNPEQPYLVLIPTIMLSAGMLMFFTLGPSMLGDICDENEMRTGRRSDGSYYSVFWWFIKMGTAFASFVTGLLIVISQFDETQAVGVDRLKGNLAVVQAGAAEGRPLQESDYEAAFAALAGLRDHFSTRPEDAHAALLLERLDAVEAALGTVRGAGDADTARAVEQLDELIADTLGLAAQSPATLFRLRAIEILLPLLLSSVSLLLTFRYPLTEDQLYRIKAELERRKETA
jgi:GPH family glycoside/pentoside/hexuronide:cation symporter